MATLKQVSMRPIRAVRRPPIPKRKPARLSVEQARAGNRNTRKPKSR